jgi:conjugal transfer pilus assembly protein TraB
MIEIIKNQWENLSEKHRQLARAGLVILSVVILAFIISSIRKDNNQLYNKKQSKIDFSDIGKKGTVESAWLERSENQLDDLKTQLEEEKKAKEELAQKLEDLSAQIEDAKEQSNQDLQAQIADLKNQINNNQTSQSQLKNNNKDKVNDPFARGDGSANYSQDDVVDNQIEGSQIDLVNFSSDSDPQKNAFSLDNYLPAGSYVKAVLISSVDASVGITAQGDPRPVLFRVISIARSAVDKDKQLTVDIKGCTITGAASADLSSERAYVRLLKMTCPSKNGKVIETDVEGYAADGSDGKAGITGKKITREGDLLGKSFLAGLIGGFGQGLSAKVAPPLSFSNGLTTQGTLSNEDVVKTGLGKGISTSSDRLQNYMIDRAEQYQPVISVASGKEVELVFISGTYLDGNSKTIKTDFKTTSSLKK